MSLLERVKEAIKRHELLACGDDVLVAVSGGPDSVALLHALKELSAELGLRLEVAHLQHGVRGEEAREDAQFVAEVTEKLGLPFHLKEVDLPRMKAEAGRGNLEEMARRERYRFFGHVAGRLGIGKVATAHTLDDQAETLLMRLLRGSGRRGLSAMAPVQRLNFLTAASSPPILHVRPLIEASRADVLKYLSDRGLPYRLDRTNWDRDLLRNWIRLDLLPQLKERTDPQLSRRLARLAEIWRGEEKTLQQLARQRLAYVKQGEALARSFLLKENKSLQRRLLRLWLEQILGDLRRFDFRHIEEALRFIHHERPQGRLALPRGWDLVKEYDVLRLQKKTGTRRAACYSYILEYGAGVHVEEAGINVESACISPAAVQMPENDMEAFFDLDQLPETLTVRNFRPGDRFQPLGMSGHKKIKDLFIERKVPLSVRARLPLLSTGGEVLWIPGYGRSEIAKIGPETKAILRVQATYGEVRESV